jgi:hypothetical protein
LARRFTYRLLLFLAPWLVYAAAIVVIDPFDLFQVADVVPEKVKLATSLRMDPALWTLDHFKNGSCANVLLGDSRMYRLAVQGYCNASLPGAHLKEIIDTFWYLDSRTRLHDVVIGINFDIYNASRNRDRVEFVRSVRTNPLLYFTNLTIAKAAAYNVYYSLLRKDPQIGVPNMSPDDFWKVQVGPTTDRFYGWYTYPEEYRSALKKIAAHCRQSDIRLRFMILPVHADLQQRVADYGLQQQYALFKEDLSSIAETIDFDLVNDMTKDRDNFTDPYHVTNKTAELIVREVWNGPLTDGRVLQQ